MYNYMRAEGFEEHGAHHASRDHLTGTHTALVPVRCKCIPHYRGTSLIRNAHPHRITVAVKPSLDA